MAALQVILPETALYTVEMDTSFIMYAVAIWLNTGRNMFNCLDALKVTVYLSLVNPVCNTHQSSGTHTNYE